MTYYRLDSCKPSRHAERQNNLHLYQLTHLSINYLNAVTGHANLLI